MVVNSSDAEITELWITNRGQIWIRHSGQFIRSSETQWSTEKHRQRSRCSTQNTQILQNTEIVNSREASTDLRTRSEYRSTQNTAQIHRSTGKSTGNFRSTTESTRSSGSTRSFRSTTRSTTLTVTGKVRKQPPANSVANTVDSITHHKFQRDRTEIVERKQIQDRGAHNYRQKNSDLQIDLQSNLQDSQLNLQADLQEDLQTDLQPDLQVRTGLEGTLQPSSLVSFPLQAETSTQERSTSTSMGGTCKQGPIRMTGENHTLHGSTRIYPLGSTRIYPLKSTRIYTLHRSTRIHTPHGTTRLTRSQDIHPNIIQCSHLEHPASPNGNLVIQSV